MPESRSATSGGDVGAPAPAESLNLERHRDRQQWILDWVLKTSGREQNFEADGRRFPSEVKSHDMIPRVMYRRGLHREHLARAAEERGHAETAVDLYYRAVEDYHLGQHAIYQDDDDEKLYICSRIDECYDQIIALHSNPIERIEVDFDGQTLSGLLHRVPGSEPRPLIVYCPGMDMRKEQAPPPGSNWFLHRGMHVLSIDGPGQGSANLRKIRLTVDNYERAASTFLDSILDRPEIDADRIGVTGRSMGSYWGMRIAAADPRVGAVATSIACYGSKRHIFERSSPRFKQIFMYMTGVHDEQEFNQLAERMNLFDVAHRISCPTLMVTGEYDPLSPLREALDVFDRVGGPKELWVIEDSFHPLRNLEQLGTLVPDVFLADWLRDAFDGRAPRENGRKVYLRTSNAGPYSPAVPSFDVPSRDGRLPWE